MSEVERQLRILEVLEHEPKTTQASLAAQLGVAVGSVNWYLKRLIRKGYIKATRMDRNRLRYLVTPQGLALKARLTSQYLEAALHVYRELREAAQETLAKVHDAGYVAVALHGEGDALEIFRLTCLEEGIRIDREETIALPTVQIDGTGFAIAWPDAGEANQA
jgi:DNA-binding MarR family transcriptional regulator